MSTELSPSTMHRPIVNSRFERWSSSKRIIVALVGVALALVFGMLIYSVWPTNVDDTFISLRYARNMASGYGPTWNINEPPVEGYTTLLWMVILAIPHILGIDALVFAKAAGVLCTITLLWLMYIAVARLGDSTKERLTFPALAAVGFMVAFIPTSVHAVTGMETALFTCLLTGYFVALARTVSDPSRNGFHLVAALGLLVGLTRPEGNVAVVSAGAVILFLLPGTYRRSFVWSLLVLYVVPGMLYMLWRTWYYQSLLPLPFLVKAVHQEPLAGRAAVFDFLGYILPRVGILCGLGAVRMGRKWLPALLGSAAFAAFWLFPAHIMGYNWRFLYPLVPLFMIAAGYGVAEVGRLGRQVFGQRKPALVHLPVLVSVVMPLLAFAVDAPLMMGMPVTEGQGLQSAHIRLGRELAEYKLRSNDSDPVLAIGDAGAAPYYSGWRTIDHFGLNDLTIARSGKHDPGYVLNQNPDVVVLISQSPDTFKSPLDYENELYRAVIDRGMVRVQVLTYLPNRHHLWVYAAPNTPVAAYLSQLH